jgi:pimeloyl-ACP methyl ester carboxylesterase
LSVPNSATAQDQVAAVIVLGGSGSVDRDATIGASKPYKDLAWGLAGSNIAVLRADKRTFGKRLKDFPTSTIDWEYTESALASFKLLLQNPVIDSKRIFILGHSLGASFVSRVAKAAMEAGLVPRGMIALSAGAGTLHWTAVKQIEAMAAKNPAYAEMAATFRKQAEAVDSPDLTADTPKETLPLEIPATYWLSIRFYIPADEMKKLIAGKQIDTFVGQGSTDFQVLPDSDYAEFKKVLSGDEGKYVTFKEWDGLNHLLSSNTDVSADNDYEGTHHVDKVVIEDLAGWIDARS